MTEELKVSYEGTELLLIFGQEPRASLCINGVERESVSSDKPAITLKLSSTVQTDYEWHECVEAIVVYSASTIRASILASKKELITTTRDRAS